LVLYVLGNFFVFEKEKVFRFRKLFQNFKAKTFPFFEFRFGHKGKIKNNKLYHSDTTYF